MPKYKISLLGIDRDKSAIATGRELPISHKHAREVCRAIKGMYLEDAKNYLEEVIALKKSIPFRRHNKKVAHRSDLTKWPSGRYPVKACKYILDILENLENNASQKDPPLDTEKLRLIHVAAHKGRILKRIMPRAQGRSSPKYQILTHVEIVATEVD